MCEVSWVDHAFSSSLGMNSELLFKCSTNVTLAGVFSLVGKWSAGSGTFGVDL